jgi:hypothetical protein
MYARDRDVADQIQVCISKRHPPLLIDEHAESVAARLDGDLTDEIAAQLRALVRHRSELCPAVREFLIIKLYLAVRHNIALADQLTTFAAQLAADFLQQLTPGQDDRAAGQSKHRPIGRNASLLPATARPSKGVSAPIAAERPGAAHIASPGGTGESERYFQCQHM